MELVLELSYKMEWKTILEYTHIEFNWGRVILQEPARQNADIFRLLQDLKRGCKI